MVEDGGGALPEILFAREDDGDDAEFYREPRFVVHIDDATIAALTEFYRGRITAGARVLDLMSSWVSHLPAEVAYSRVAGHGMNAAELAANPRLDEYRVVDLNRNPVLPWRDGAFDAVLIAVSIQYLTRPLAVFAEIGRVLAPGGEVIVSTSHRCFPTKAIRAFRDLPPAERIRLIGIYLDDSGLFDVPEFHDRSPAGADPLWIVTGRRREDED